MPGNYAERFKWMELLHYSRSDLNGPNAVSPEQEGMSRQQWENERRDYLANVLLDDDHNNQADLYQNENQAITKGLKAGLKSYPMSSQNINSCSLFLGIMHTAQTKKSIVLVPLSP